MRRWMRFAAWALAAALFVGGAYAAQLGLAEARREAQILLDDAGSSATGAGVEIDGGTVTVRAAGVYRVRGALSEGQLRVKVDKGSDVTLILDGADIANAADAAILVESANRVTLRLAEGSVNRVRSGEPVEISADAADADASGGAIRARDDLAIEGSGKLCVQGYVNNGIHCSNRLTISGGEIEVEAVNNGVKGKDGVILAGGRLAIRAGGDGIESDAEDGAGYGTIELAGGTVSIESFGDGVQAATALTVSGGELTIASGGGSAAAQPRREERPGRFGGARWDRDEEADAPSAKGLKAGEALTISGGSVRIDAADDALHSDGALAVTGGTLNLATGDDGAHADEALTVSGGAITISTAYEGIEANQVLISGGEIDVAAADDGINANGGTNPGGRGFGPGGFGGPRGGAGEAPPAEEGAEPLPSLRITGGSLHIDAEGDGLDSNGDLTVEGGAVVVDGPSRGGNGALDSGAERGGRCRVSGGTVLAIGAAGMAEGFDDASAQASFSHEFAAALPAGTEITVEDADGNALFSHVSAKGFASVVFSCPELMPGETCVLRAGSERVEVVTVGN